MKKPPPLPTDEMSDRIISEYEEWVNKQEGEDGIKSLLNLIHCEIVGPQFNAGFHRLTRDQKKFASDRVYTIMLQCRMESIEHDGAKWIMDGDRVRCELLF